MKNKSKISSEQREGKCLYPAFKVVLKEYNEKRMNDRLILDIEGTAEELHNDIQQNVSAIAL